MIVLDIMTGAVHTNLLLDFTKPQLSGRIGGSPVDVQGTILYVMFLRDEESYHAMKFSRLDPLCALIKSVMPLDEHTL